MKKSTMKQIVALVNGQQVADMDALRDEINSEWARLTEKSEANAKAYAAAKEIVLGVMSTTPQTAEEIYAACQADLPDDFTKGKVQYALLHYWEAEVVKTENGKNPNTYALKSAE